MTEKTASSVTLKLQVTLARRHTHEPPVHTESFETFRLSDMRLLPPARQKKTKSSDRQPPDAHS